MSSYYLRDHYRMMQGGMKLIILSYFWIKMLTLLAMITLIAFDYSTENKTGSIDLIWQVGQTHVIFMTYALQQIIFFIFGFQMKIVEIQLIATENAGKVVDFLKKLKNYMRCVFIIYLLLTVINMIVQLVFIRFENKWSSNWRLTVNILVAIFSVGVVIPWQIFKMGL